MHLSNTSDGDDKGIADDWDLWRRVSSQFTVPDENHGGRRPSSQAFQNARGTDRMSVIVGRETPGPEQAIAGHEGYGVASFLAGLARACGQSVRRDPTRDQPAHALVIGPKPKTVLRRLVEGSTWLIEPTRQ